MAEHGPLQYSSPWFLASCVKVTHVFLTPTDRWFSCSVCSLPFTEEGIRNVYRHVLAFICKSRLSRLQSSRESNKQPPGICHHAGSQVRGPGPSGLSLPSLTSPPPPAGAPGGLSAPRRCPGGGSRKPAAVLPRRRDALSHAGGAIIDFPEIGQRLWAWPLNASAYRVSASPRRSYGDRKSVV